MTSARKNGALTTGKAFARAIFFLAACLAFPATAPAAGRVPALEGPSIRLDFEQPFIERWYREVPADAIRAVLPRVEGVRWEEIGLSPAWETAAALAPLTAEEPKTEFHAFYGEGGLYFRARNHFELGALPTATSSDHFRWQEDLVEIRLHVPSTVPGAENPYFHFGVSPAGARYDPRDAETRARVPWFSRAEISDNAWTAWMMIPFSVLELGGPVPEIQVNIGREGPAVTHLSWGPGWPETSRRRVVLEGAAAPERGDGPPENPPGPLPEHRGLRAGKGISLEWITGDARPQDRWIEGTVSLDPAVFRPGDTVEVFLRAPDGREIESARAEPDRFSGMIMIDLRRWGLESAEVEARLARAGEALGLARSYLRALEMPPAPETGRRIPLVVNLPGGPASTGHWPLMAGVPFPAGMLWQKDGWVVEDGEGRTYPTQLEVTGRWAFEGALKWLRVDTLAPPDEELSLVYRPGSIPPEHANPVRVEMAGDGPVLSNGLVSYRLSAEGSPVREILVGGRVLARAAGTRGLYLVDREGRTARASAEGAGIRVESAGPVNACVRIEGDYRTEDGQPLARHITRVELSAGRSFARIVHTLVLTRDTNETWFREAGWEMEVAPGANPESFFAVSRDDPGNFRRFPAAGETRLVQESYFRFGEGEKRFGLYRDGAGVLSGEEMGDWFMLQGAGGGLMISCREAARQHPKEFSVAGSRMNLLLFSPRSGEEMDFRTETLIERWNLREWLTGHGVPSWFVRGDHTPAERVEKVIEENSRITSNALGWAKTHEIVFSPAPAPAPPEEAAGISNRHSRPVFTLADPWWIYRSRAMGPLYPRDPERFPDAERLVDGALDFWSSRMAEAFGYFGFIDYNAGPTFHHEPGKKYPMPRRWNYLYTIRPDSWRVLARSGSRRAFDFATGTCRAWADNHFASWDGPRTIKGLYTSRGGPDHYTGTFALPFYWGQGTNQVHSNHMTNNDQFAWDYHLTGWRRAGDQLRDYASGLRRRWTPEYKAWGQATLLASFRLLLQSYEFTWDRDFRELAYDAFDLIENPAGELGLHEVWPGHASSYKIQVHFRDILAAWEFFGDPRFHRVMMKVGPYLRERNFLGDPVSYCSPTGILGHFLYGETRCPSIPAELLVSLRRTAAGHGSEGDYPVAPTSPNATFYFEGIPAVLDVLSRSGADRSPVCSTAGARDFGRQLEFFARSPKFETLHLAASGPSGGARIGGQSLELLDPAVGWDMMSARLRAGGYGRWKITPDIPGDIFRLTPGTGGDHQVMAWGDRPMPGLVLHAPSWWMPLPAQSPPAPWYFRVPETSVRPALFFENPTLVRAPGGDAWRETGFSEWVELDPGRPGLWSFVPLEPGLVRARDLPPFFAAGHPGSWFDPGFETELEEEKEPEPMPDRPGFVGGAGAGPGLYLPANSRLVLEGGETLEGGLGREFLPFHSGTVEFWYKPVDWDSFHMPGDPRKEGVIRHLARLGTWQLQYGMNYVNPLNINHFALRYFMTIANEENQRLSYTGYRHNTIFEKGQWVHLAVTWGPRTRNLWGRIGTGMEFSTFVDGRRGTVTGMNFRQSVGHLPMVAPGNLVIFGGGVIDHLRVSDVIRYRADFEPHRGSPAVDRHTRALFSFDETLEGITGDGRAVEVKLSP